MKYRVLISAPYMQPVVDSFRHEIESRGAEIIVPPVTERLSEEELLALVGEIDGVIAGDDRFTERVLLKAVPRLKVISKWGTGIDAFDLEACRRLGVVVRNIPGAFTKPVADSVMGYMLNFARRLSWMDEEMKRGTWNKIPGRALHECTLGIVGLGNIGTAVAKLAAAFGMKVYANDIREIEAETIGECRVEMTSLSDLLGRADFVSVNCDLNPTSRHLMNEHTFAQMKNGAVIINLARGPIIHEESLVRALKRKKVGGAALDVFEDEPLPADSPLLSMSNVMLAPHNSNSSPAAWQNVHKTCIRNLFEVLETTH